MVLHSFFFRGAIGAIFLLFFYFFPLNTFGQMRQVYIDNLQPSNEVCKIDFYSPSSGYVAFRDWVGYTTDSGRTFIRKYITSNNVDYNGFNVNLTFGFGINGVKAFNQNNIIVYGDYGLVPSILYSTNGGNSFKLIYHSQYNPFQLIGGIADMVFPQNSAIGYAIDKNRILKTTNQGLNWSVIRADPNGLFDYIEAVDDNNIFVLTTDYAANKLLRTTNGGNSWLPVSFPTVSNGKMSYANFLTANEGWLAIYDNNSNGYLYKTVNGGISWALLNNLEATPFFSSKMKFIDNNTGYTLGGLYSIFKTQDGGITWEPLPRTNDFTYLGYTHNNLQCISANQLWAGGGYGLLELSTNGGGTSLPRAYFRIDTVNVWQSNTVNLVNYSRPGYQYKWYVNNIQISAAYNASYTHNILRQVDTVQLIVTSGTLSDTIEKYQYFNVPNLPNITSFFPVTGSVGTVITIKGTGFSGVNSVKFGGIDAASFTIVSDQIISATVAGGATGAVSIKNIFGTSSRPGFAYFPPPTSPPPSIQSMIPQSGNIGTSVTLTGSNFNPSPSGNIVFFGATKALVTAATSSQITCNVPAGASFETVSVLNTVTNLTGQSSKPFHVTFSDSSNFTVHSFAQAYQITFGNNTFPKDVAGKDIDGDGKVDLMAVVNRFGDSISIFRNTTSGGAFSFAKAVSVPVPSFAGPGHFDFDDLDGDGRPEAVVSTNASNVLVLKNNSSPGFILFENGVSIPIAGGSQDIAIADIDNDGRNDITTASYGGGVSVLRNTSVPGYLSFAGNVNYPTSEKSVGIATGDLDGDGKLDIVSYNFFALNASDSHFSSFRNTSVPGTISFAPKSDIVVPGTNLQGNDITIADMDKDGKPDVVITNDDNYYCVFRNTSVIGSISFAPVINYGNTNSISQGATVANLSGDDRPDYLTGWWSTGRFSVLRNISIPGIINSDPALNVPQPSPYYTNVADFDGDGKADIVTSNPSGTNIGAISIYKNTMGIPVEFSLCAGGNTGVEADITAATYQWQRDTGTGFANIFGDANISGTQNQTIVFQNIPITWSGYKFRCVGNNNMMSSVFTMKVNGIIVPSVDIIAPNTNICYGTSVTFTATGINGGLHPTYQWQVNGINVGTDSINYTSTTLNNGDQVRAILFSSDYCSNFPIDTSNVITMSVNGSAPSVSISASGTSVCAGSAVTFIATSVNAGLAPAYQWKVNDVNVGTNSSSFTSAALNNGDKVKVIITSFPTCGGQVSVSSNEINMQVNVITTPLVSISASPSTPTCTGTTVYFNAIPNGGGNNPSYQWQINGSNVGSNFSQFFFDGFNDNDQVKVILTSNYSCTTNPTALSNVIALSVAPVVTPAVSISGTTTVVQGKQATITAAATNGGGLPIYQWQDSTNSNGWKNISGSTNATISYAPMATGQRLRCLLTSNANCANPQMVTSNAITFTVTTVTAINPVPANSLGIKYYPNPVNSVFMIDSLKLSDRWETVELVSIDGRHKMRLITVAGQQKISLDLSFLPAGYYLAILNRKKGTPVYLKFMKQ
jgi:hypothetical protein